MRASRANTQTTRCELIQMHHILYLNGCKDTMNLNPASRANTETAQCVLIQMHSILYLNRCQDTVNLNTPLKTAC